jgi:hypothetical protein
MSELDRVLERVRQNRTARADSLTVARVARTTDAGNALEPHPIGARVFDLVTGQEGSVVGTTRENVIVPVTQRTDG